MAEMVPESLPASSTAGEKRVFGALERLPADCLVYYEPVVQSRHPDLIVVMPDIGVLVIEVKDWRLAELETVTAETVTINRRGVSTVVAHPRRQARGYMLRLMDECRKHPWAQKLMQDEGRHAGGFVFPFCHITVLSNINRSQIEREAPDLMRLFPPGVTITRDELATWDDLDPQALLTTLKACFDPWWMFPKLTPEQVDVLRGVIHPEVVIRASETELAVLDLCQERHARAIGDGHRIVYGVAGSGKTVLLIARAKLLPADPDKRILVLCYNRLLAQHLAASLADHRAVQVKTFHAWALGAGIEFRKGEDDADFGARFLARLQSDESLRAQFDAVLIDEAQDWPCSWFMCAKLALKEPDTGDLLIVGDGSQSLYRTPPELSQHCRDPQHRAAILREARGQHSGNAGASGWGRYCHSVRIGPAAGPTRRCYERDALRGFADRDLAACRRGYRRAAPACPAKRHCRALSEENAFRCIRYGSL